MTGTDKAERKSTADMIFEGTMTQRDRTHIGLLLSTPVDDTLERAADLDC